MPPRTKQVMLIDPVSKCLAVEERTCEGSRIAPKFWSEHLGEGQHESLRRGQRTTQKTQIPGRKTGRWKVFHFVVRSPNGRSNTLVPWTCYFEHLRNVWLFFISYLHPHSFLPRRDESCWHSGLYYALSMQKKKSTIESKDP